jgi:hypothetical protein
LKNRLNNLIDYINIFTSMLKEPRSDIMKELTYSRQMTNKCSVTQNNFGNQARMLSCTRAEDEKIPSILNGSAIVDNRTYDHYCYGTALGNLRNQSLTDNWFCCQEWQKNPAPRNQP